MGTRGFVGFVVDGVEKIGYTHWGGHAEGVDTSTLNWLRDCLAEEVTVEQLRERARALRVVDDAVTPTPEDVERLRPYTDLHVGEQSAADWYCLLRHAQGNAELILKAGYVEDASRFPLDSLFAEFGVIVDLDAETFEAFEGFQEAPHDKGRFAARKPGGDYWPVALVGSWSFASLPTQHEFLKAAGVLDEDKEG